MRQPASAADNGPRAVFAPVGTAVARGIVERRHRAERRLVHDLRVPGAGGPVSVDIDFGAGCDPVEFRFVRARGERARVDQPGVCPVDDLGSGCVARRRDVLGCRGQ